MADVRLGTVALLHRELVGDSDNLNTAADVLAEVDLVDGGVEPFVVRTQRIENLRNRCEYPTSRRGLNW